MSHLDSNVARRVTEKEKEMTQPRQDRPSDRVFDDPLLTFDLPSLVTHIKSEEAWRTAQRRAMTLVNTPELRVVLMVLHAGTVVPPHRSDGPITVQTIQGQITFSAGTQTVSLKEGEMLTVPKGLEHSLEALEESAFLLTITIQVGLPVTEPVPSAT